MESLDKKYASKLDEIKEAIQNSDILATYLDTEEDEHYKALLDAFEPSIIELFQEVANVHPLQLVSFENYLLDPGFEGLFLPKSLGYSVLRGEVNENYKYRKPQNHFKDTLEAICESANFDHLRKRIGQTVQVGFALSSDIWITNFLNSIENKKVKAYLLSLKNDQFRDLKQRTMLYNAYSNQLSSTNFQSTSFPVSDIELDSSYHSIKSFFIYRAQDHLNNDSLMTHVGEFIKNKDIHKSEHYLEMLILSGALFLFDKKQSEDFSATIKSLEKESNDFESDFFEVYTSILEEGKVKIGPEEERRLSKLMKAAASPEISSYFAVTDELHAKGFVHVDAIEAIRKYYDNHKGVSLQNDCLRAAIRSYIENFMDNLEPEFYNEYFEINKIAVAYIGIFGNEKFNQDVKRAVLRFIKRCLKQYTDKRGRDYQDIKKFVQASFRNLGFMTDKQLVELFKTKRKKIEA